jgi:MoxR-like ATPase
MRCFKANSAILNSMLTILNERLYHNNGGAVKVPLQFCVGASNEFPQGEELTALFDRFLVRMVVNPIADDSNFAAMLVAGGPPANPTTLTAAEVAALHSQVGGVVIPDAVRVAVVELRRSLKAEGIVASDRRWRESLSLVKAAATLAGRTEAEVADLEVLRHVLWSDPGHKDKAQGIVLSIVNPHRKAAIEILDEARSVWGATTAKGLSLDSATEIHEKLKKLKARAAKAARESGSGEFAEAGAYIAAKLKEVGMAILGTTEEE